ncbi:hypothetical protein C7460_11473 [Marinoscillum furvescens DSM 4134]|uniref:Uncharacterized protein n=1 Tax=Marinoscillum furvescens DSM 4134 TaxID=1122208 RepID=A0A3D9L2E9_MARFU|nr:hypothetical protein C7460_11473 [Marinoscillum furvescens DSM 4134]
MILLANLFAFLSHYGVDRTPTSEQGISVLSADAAICEFFVAIGCVVILVVILRLRKSSENNSI